MQLEQVRESIESTPKGANIIVEWSRNAKTKKNADCNIVKQVRMVGRIGIEYDNQQVVKDKRENGELPAENNGLPWGRFEVYPYLIEHRGQRYVRLYKGTSDKVKPSVVWVKNGVEVDADEVIPYLLKSEYTSKQGDCFCVKVEDITRLHREMENVADAEKVAVAEVAEPVE